MTNRSDDGEDVVCHVDSVEQGRNVPAGPMASQDTGLTIHWDTMPTHDRKKKPAVIYTPEQMVGEWVMGTLHEQYNADGSGMTWDMGDDVQVEEAKNFVWTLSENGLTAYYPMSLGGVVPQVSYVTLVDSTQMVRCDGYGNEYRYYRAPQEMTVEKIFAVR